MRMTLDTSALWTGALIATATLIITSCSTPLEEQIATSPLVGAERVNTRGVGVVEERLTAGRYTYLRFAEAPEGTWHVVSGAAPEQGERTAYRGYARLEGYTSPTLDRSFETLFFTSVRPSSSGAKTTTETK